MAIDDPMTKMEVKNFLASSRTAADWNNNSRIVKKAFGGQYPDWWYEEIHPRRWHDPRRQGPHHSRLRVPGEGVMSSLEKTVKTELFAWLGEDELGSGFVGLKHGICIAGDDVPLVATNRAKIEKFRPQLEAQAHRYGKRIRLCRFIFAEVVVETREGE